MPLQSDRLLGHMQRLRLSRLPACFQTLAEEAAAKNLPISISWSRSWKPRARPSIPATCA